MKIKKLKWEKIPNTGGAKESIHAISCGLELHIDKLETGYRLFVRLNKKGAHWSCLGCSIKTPEQAKLDAIEFLSARS